MVLKNIVITIIFLFLSYGFSQNTCSEIHLEDINIIGKCAIDKFRKSNRTEYIKINTVRQRKIKRNFKTVNRSILKQKKAEVIVSDFIAFDKVDEIPIFIDCANYEKSVRQDCVKELMTHSILENLIYPFDAASEEIQGKIWVRFIIDTDGYVKNITTRGFKNSKLLEQEAKRIIGLLPKFIPGKYNNNYVNVEYFLPIDFRLDK